MRSLVRARALTLTVAVTLTLGLGIQNLTFSVPEIEDFKSRATTVAAFGDFSTLDFTLIGFGREPRLVKAGVVNGSFFEVMGLRPLLGRLLTPADAPECGANDGHVGSQAGPTIAHLVVFSPSCPNDQRSRL